MSDYLTIHEAGALLKCSPDLVRGLCKSGELDHVNRSGTKRITRLIPRDAIERYLCDRRQQRDVELHQRVRRLAQPAMRIFSGGDGALGR